MRYDVVIIGGGLAGITAGLKLQQSGLHTVVVSAGLSLHETPRAEYVSAGGTILAGDTVVKGIIEDGHLKHVLTSNLGVTEIHAENFILCTGKFFSKGLVSTMDRIYEPIFGCDVDYEADHSKWVAPEFGAEQPFMSIGIVTDEDCRVMIEGKVIDNLYAAGEILAGKVDIVESALKVCRKLI